MKTKFFSDDRVARYAPIWTRTLAFFVSLLFAGISAAANVQITDKVRLRAGNGDNFRTIQTLAADTPVELLEAGQDYSQIKTAQGQIGWVKSTFLKQFPQDSARAESVSPTAVACDHIQKDALSLREQLAELRQELEHARSATQTQRWSFALTGLLLGMLVGTFALRTYYLKRLRGLRI